MIHPGPVIAGTVLSGVVLLGPIPIDSGVEMIVLLTADGLSVSTADDLLVYINP